MAEPSAALPLGKTGRLPADVLQRVRPEHVRQAVETLSGRTTFEPFGPSTDYDLLTFTGERLPPKAVFGAAAGAALGFAVLPEHFSAGELTPCFRALGAAGYAVVAKVSRRSTQDHDARRHLPILPPGRGASDRLGADVASARTAGCRGLDIVARRYWPRRDRGPSRRSTA